MDLHKRRRETHFSLGRITSVTQEKIIILTILRRIASFPLGRVTRLTLRRVRNFPLERKIWLVLRTPSGIGDPWEGLSRM
jgi:hypothetical protein